MLASIALAAAVLGGQFQPNYADRLLSPWETRDVHARLFPARFTDPIRVAVAPDPNFITDDRLGIVRTACEKWATATEDAPKAFHFKFVDWDRPGDADIVFSFQAMVPWNELRGVTEEKRGWALVNLAVEDSKGEGLSHDAVLRVATHELGHALGIWGHSPDSGDMMSTSETAVNITPADVNTLELAYAHNRPGFGLLSK